MSTNPPPNGPRGVADLAPLAEAQARRREQRGWYVYDWANSAFATTIAGVLFAPYLIAVAEDAAGGADGRLDVLGFGVAPGALPSFVITFSTLLSAVLLPLVGAVADRLTRKKDLLAGFAWTGALASSMLFFTVDGRWQVGVAAFLVANLCFGAAIVVSDSILCRISEPEERDRVSSRGWALGYAGGGLVLAVNFAVVSLHEQLGISEGLAVRLSMLMASLWWAGFTVVPWLRLRNHPPLHAEPVEGGVVARSFGQLAGTLRDIRNYPVALTFLLAYLFFNDGIQTVIASASTFGVEELGFDTGTVLATYLLVQFVAVGGALLFGRAAERVGAKRVVLVGLLGWMTIVTSALFLPAGELGPFLVLGAAIGIVLGGTQALARSLFSRLIPAGREAEWFSFYHAMERGTSWFGTLTFGLVFQFTGSYRPALFALIAFFVVGGLLLLKVDVARGEADARRSA